jgi:tetratricopeptide (TPR) repeat protein
MMIPLILLVSLAAQSPQHLLGAEGVLREMKVPLPAGKGSDPVKIVALESAALRAKLPGLPTKAAASAWVDLVRDWETRVPAQPQNNGQPNGWDDVIKALPAPESWPAIRQGLIKLPAARTAPIIAGIDDLLGNNAAVLKYLEARQKEIAQASAEQPFALDDRTSYAVIPLAIRTGNLDFIEKTLLASVKRAGGMSWYEYPDLVALLGRKRTETILRAIYEGGNPGVRQFGSGEMQRLAREIVASDIGHMKAPDFDLIAGLDDYPFVAAQVARFGEKSLEQNDWAKIVYGFGLYRSGKVDDGLRVLSSAQVDWASGYVFDLVDPSARARIYLDIQALLQRKIIPALVPVYVRLGRILGHSDDVDRQIGSWLAGSTTEAPERQYLLGAKASIATSFGKIDEAIADYEQGIGLTDAHSPDQGAGLAASLLALATATNNPEAVSFVARAAKSFGTRGGRLHFFDAYLRMDRIADAQNAALAAMADTNNVNLGAEGQGRLLNAYPEVGVELSELYYKANEPEQVVTLLHEFPKWGARDLIDVLSQRSGDEQYRGKHGEPLGFFAAWALAETGQKEKAIQVLHALIPTTLAEGHPWNSQDLSDDSAYELLNRLQGQAALSFYDGIIRGYPFEARPRMWRGDLMLRLGKPGEAERDVRAAIALDPSDRSAGHGERNRAYEILGRVLDAEGKGEGAETCRKVVNAARLAEEALRANEDGFSSKSVDLYKQALAANPSDSKARLEYAYLLDELGQNAEARTEYEKAAELVLSSEGPIGGAGFDLWHATTGADAILKVFNRLRREHPNDPGLLTCLGGLQAEIGDYRGALENYEKAVASETHYIRAWRGIKNLQGRGVLSRKIAKEATLALIRLEPGESNISTPHEFGDFAALWHACGQASKLLYPLPVGPLFPLEASRRALAAGGRPAGEGPFLTFRERAQTLRDGPGAALGRLSELQTLFP